MSGTGISIGIKNRAISSVLPRAFDFSSVPPPLVKREAAPRRTKIWEFSTNLHCSIIGTCLSNTELRQVMRKSGLASQDCTDHELHSVAVSLAGRHDDAARQLHKLLDQRHKLAVNQFAKAGTEDALRALWRDAVRRGDIPGAYWATLTHPLSSHSIIREAFGEVHMLSHLVGSANRADIRRLCVLEAEKAALETKVERQQQALHEVVVGRDIQVKELRQALTKRIVHGSSKNTSGDTAALRGLVADLEGRLAAEVRRRAAVEDRLASAQAAAAREHAGRIKAQRTCDAIRQELDAIESSLLETGTSGQGLQPQAHLDGVTVLYVGGRPNQIPQMRVVVEKLGAVFLHHDGGIEHHTHLLPGLASRSDLILFPVDCISHDAASAVKSLCRQGGKPFIPLRSASITSLLAALQAQEAPSVSTD